MIEILFIYFSIHIYKTLIRIPPHVRSIIYNQHFQNTYDIRDWEFFFRLYDVQNDILEEELYLKALTFTRLPWLLSE